MTTTEKNARNVSMSLTYCHYKSLFGMIVPKDVNFAYIALACIAENKVCDAFENIFGFQKGNISEIKINFSNEYEIISLERNALIKIKNCECETQNGYLNFGRKAELHGLLAPQRDIAILFAITASNRDYLSAAYRLSTEMAFI
jgi:hypothetical protein